MIQEDYEQELRGEPFRAEEEIAQEVPLESQCIECGNEALGMCACCGSNLCGMHEEIQAGFCSSFTSKMIFAGDVVQVHCSDHDLKGEFLRFKTPQKISGCFHHIEDEINVIYVMDSEPDHSPEINMDQVEVIENEPR